MSIETEIFDAAKSLFPSTDGQPRFYGGSFPLDPKIPKTPAARFVFISSEQVEDICGTDGGRTANSRVQVDIVHTSYLACRNLRQAVIDAIEAMPTPARLDGGFDDFDHETKLHRCSIDFVIYPSS